MPVATRCLRLHLQILHRSRNGSHSGLLPRAVRHSPFGPLLTPGLAAVIYTRSRSFMCNTSVAGQYIGWTATILHARVRLCTPHRACTP
eukprot:scaffold8867_cov118-Isochrysis_galbana.AAC.16